MLHIPESFLSLLGIKVCLVLSFDEYADVMNSLSSPMSSKIALKEKLLVQHDFLVMSPIFKSAKAIGIAVEKLTDIQYRDIECHCVSSFR